MGIFSVAPGTKLSDHIIIGTPGKVLDWGLKYRVIDLKKIRVFVLDEADVMIATQGHHDQCIRIHKYVKPLYTCYKPNLTNSNVLQTTFSKMSNVVLFCNIWQGGHGICRTYCPRSKYNKVSRWSLRNNIMINVSLLAGYNVNRNLLITSSSTMSSALLKKKSTKPFKIFMVALPLAKL